MFGFHTKSFRPTSSTSRRERGRANLGLEPLEQRDTPSALGGLGAAAATFSYRFPPSPIMPRMAAVNLALASHYPPSAVVTQLSASAFHFFPPQPI